CRVTVDGKVKFACVDGPDFDAHKVDFKELIVRQQRFKSQEERAAEFFSHTCNLEKQLFEEEKRNYKKLKDLAPKQVEMPERDPVERSQNFLEVNLGYSMDNALEEAERCIQCKKPMCVAGCPVSIDIPKFIRHLLVRDLDGALATLNDANLFPSICGRVCPQEMQCEVQCILARKMEPVAIGRLERFVGDNAPTPKARPPKFEKTLGRVAIAGSGPGGLAAAADLVRYGCEVTVFEALHVIGGVLRYGIPSFRLPREIIAREVQRLRDLGVKFETNKVIGKTFTIEQLLEDHGFDAAFVAAGAGAPSFLGIPGEFAGQVYSANEFLTRVNLMGGDKFPYLDTPIGLGKSVVVIGAGNTAMDCLRVSKRLGAPTVRCVYRRSEAEAPARIEELRHAKEEGIDFFFLHTPVEIHTDEAGNVKGMRVQKMELGEPDDQGRRRPVPLDEFVELDCDTVIYALGTNANPIVTESTPGLGLNKWGYIVADDATQATNLPGVWAGGDIVTGGATVILAMGAGRRAARAIGAWLQNGKDHWPVTAEEAEAFSPAPQIMEVEGYQPSEADKEKRGKGIMLCPKCHRPIEGEERYICCADQELQWKCQDCGKVSEGFAFPYGVCPHCSGKLEVLGDREIANSESLEAIRVAFEIELSGQAFYRAASEGTSDEAVGRLFASLVDMEQEHMETLSKRYRVPVPASTNGNGKRAAADWAAIYTGVEVDLDDPATLFEAAIKFEERAVAYFVDRQRAAAEGSLERQLYKEMAAEEREHVALLKTERDRWKQGKTGIL
ncbi:MAG: NADPH-dependent glutamate synthase, partial [Rhodospirillales bacterium]|nr:NADPH-dependent glutamate synthase [Rhodospirillales bacterium]